MLKPSRRSFFLIGIASLSAVIAGAAVSRFLSTPALKNWQGNVLSERQASILLIAAQEFIPEKDESTHLKTVENIDLFLMNLPFSLVGQIQAAIEAFENLTFLDIRIGSFSQMASSGRQSYLRRLFKLGGLFRLIGKTIRDLCLLGYYQQDTSWKQLSYSGPMIKERQLMSKQYADLVASPIVNPKSQKI